MVVSVDLFFSFHILPFHKVNFLSLARPPQCKEDALRITRQWLFQPVSVVSMPREEEMCMCPDNTSAVGKCYGV